MGADVAQWVKLPSAIPTFYMKARLSLDCSTSNKVTVNVTGKMIQTLGPWQPGEWNLSFSCPLSNSAFQSKTNKSFKKLYSY